jgi:hypothetical protein
MGFEWVYRPLEGWPREFTPPQLRKRKPFQVTDPKLNVAFLRRELVHLGVSGAIVQTAHAEDQISKLSGAPILDRTPKHPGVIVAADTKHGALKWVCDDCAKWTDNLRAIALTLERLRLADRYGVTRRGEQYTGWKMLPGPITSAAQAAAPAMTIDEAARFVAGVVEGVSVTKILGSRGIWEAAYKDAAKRLHPDKSKDAAGWRQLQDAKQLLDGLHNRR